MKNEFLNYTEYLFNAALAKSANLADAEDLAQETLLAAFTYQARGGTISNVRSWLLATLDHKWNDMLRQKYRLPMVSIDMVADEREMEETVPETPSAEQVRREVAYLAKLQREVIVRHYLQGQNVQRIAHDLGVPKGTVLSRLSSGREQMRKGLEKMEQYEKQSYIPERLDIGIHGCPGLHGKPWSLVSDDLMKQNILIIAYDKPLAVVDIAKALGIPTPYIENAVEDLVKSELMHRNGNKVFTDFLIVSPEQILKRLDEEILLAESHYNVIWSCMKALFGDLDRLEWFDRLGLREKESLRYYAMLDVFSRGIYTSIVNIVGEKEVYPSRPDGGSWIAVGKRYPMDFDFESYRFRQYCYGGERRANWENFLGSKSIELHVYDTQPDLNRYEHGPVEIHDDNLCKLLYIIHQGIPCEETAFDPMFMEDIPHLAQCGVLQYEQGRPQTAIPIVSKAQYGELWNLILAYMDKLSYILENPLRKAFPRMKFLIPRQLEGRVAKLRQYSCYAIPMAVVKKAIAEGDFLKNVDYPTPPMVLVIEQ